MRSNISLRSHWIRNIKLNLMQVAQEKVSEWLDRGETLQNGINEASIAHIVDSD